MNTKLHSKPWSKRRYDWKKDLNKSSEPTKAAKNFGRMLCDDYVGRDTGQCWPSNVELAQAQNVDVRTVQRHLKELIDTGWIRIVHIPRRRRGLQITWPHQAKHDTKDGTKNDSDLSKPSLKGDKAVAPYIEPSKNQVKKATYKTVLKWQPVEATDDLCLSEWRSFLDKKGYENVEAVLKLVKVGNDFRLPCKYPKCDPQDQAIYTNFFATVIASNGKCVH